MRKKAHRKAWGLGAKAAVRYGSGAQLTVGHQPCNVSTGRK
jgi:hypothetical protein